MVGEVASNGRHGNKEFIESKYHPYNCYNFMKQVIAQEHHHSFFFKLTPKKHGYAVNDADGNLRNVAKRQRNARVSVGEGNHPAFELVRMVLKKNDNEKK